MDWSALPGEPHVIRLSASALERRGGACGDFAAFKSRPRLRPPVHEPRRYAPWVDFPLGLVTAVLDDVEFDGDEPDEAIAKVLGNSRDRIHPGVASWVRHACDAYLDTADVLAAQLRHEGITLLPERTPRVAQWGTSAAELRVLTAWGRWYGTADGSMVEFRRLRMNHPRATTDQASTLAMAHVAAAGASAMDAREVYTAIPVPVRHDRPRPSRVRVVEVGLTSGTELVLLDTTPEEVRRTYISVVRPAAAALLAGGTRTPGRDCAACLLRPSCDALPVAPGLLGIDDPGTHRRTWSITTSRRYELCPAQAHLRELWLPGAGDSSAAVDRGRNVHRWLAAAHARGRACTRADLPEVTAADCGLADDLMDRADYHVARPYLLSHIEMCPLSGGEEITDIRIEPTMAVHDPLADVVVLAEPDLLRRANGRLIYREVKTSALPGTLTPENALAAAPQLALAVSLIAAGTFGEPVGVVELEQLGPETAAPVLTFDVSDPGVVAAARAIVHSRARKWHRDVEFRAKPGPWCRYCPVSRWCSQASAAPTGDLGPRAEAVAELLAETAHDDEPPF
jgi:hypothetical protein